MHKIILGSILISSFLLAKPYIENYTEMYFTKEQANKNIPPITAYSIKEAVKNINDVLQAKNANLVFTIKKLEYSKLDKFSFEGGSLKDLISYLNSLNFFVKKESETLYVLNHGLEKYQIGEFHTKKEKIDLKKKILSRAEAKSVKEEKFFNKEFFTVDASPYGQKIAKNIIDKDKKEQMLKSKRLQIEFTKGDTQILVAGIRLSKPMTVQRFFKDLGGQNSKNYIVLGNANIPMNDNIVVHNAKQLSRYLKTTTGVVLRTKRDGKHTIVEVVKK